MIYPFKFLAISSSVLLAGGAVSGATYIIIESNKNPEIFSLQQATSTLKSEITSSEKTIEEQKALIEATKAKILEEQPTLLSKTTAYKALLESKKTTLETQETANATCTVTEKTTTQPAEEEQTTGLLTHPEQTLEAPEQETYPTKIISLEDCLISESLYSDLVERRSEHKALLAKVQEGKKAFELAKAKLIVTKDKSIIKPYWKQKNQQMPAYTLILGSKTIDFEAQINANRKAEREFSASSFMLQYSEKAMERQKAKLPHLVDASLELQTVTHGLHVKHLVLQRSPILIAQKESQIAAAKEQIEKNTKKISEIKEAKKSVQPSKPIVK